MRSRLELLLLRKQKFLKHKHTRTQNQSRTHTWSWNRHAGTGTSAANFTAGIVQGYYFTSRLPSQQQSYPGQSLEPRPGTAVRPASLLHLRAHTHGTQYSTQISLSSSGDDRGYPPCSSSLLEPELPSSQQLLVLVPLPDRLFPPTGPPPGARPLLLPEASGFLSSIAGILAASSG